MPESLTATPPDTTAAAPVELTPFAAARQRLQDSFRVAKIDGLRASHPLNVVCRQRGTVPSVGMVLLRCDFHGANVGDQAVADMVRGGILTPVGDIPEVVWLPLDATAAADAILADAGSTTVAAIAGILDGNHQAARRCSDRAALESLLVAAIIESNSAPAIAASFSQGLSDAGRNLANAALQAKLSTDHNTTSDLLAIAANVALAQCTRVAALGRIAPRKCSALEASALLGLMLDASAEVSTIAREHVGTLLAARVATIKTP